MNVLSMLRPKYLLTYVQDDDLLAEGLKQLRESGYTAVPVIDQNGIYVGTVNEGDFLKCILNHGVTSLTKLHMRDIVKEGWNPAVRDDVDLEELIQCSLEQNFVPMTDDRGCFIGIITRREIIKAMLGENEEKVFVCSSLEKM